MHGHLPMPPNPLWERVLRLIPHYRRLQDSLAERQSAAAETEVALQQSRQREQVARHRVRRLLDTSQSLKNTIEATEREKRRLEDERDHMYQTAVEADGKWQRTIHAAQQQHARDIAEGGREGWYPAFVVDLSRSTDTPIGKSPYGRANQAARLWYAHHIGNHDQGASLADLVSPDDQKRLQQLIDRAAGTPGATLNAFFSVLPYQYKPGNKRHGMRGDPVVCNIEIQSYRLTDQDLGGVLGKITIKDPKVAKWMERRALGKDNMCRRLYEETQKLQQPDRIVITPHLLHDGKLQDMLVHYILGNEPQQQMTINVPEKEYPAIPQLVDRVREAAESISPDIAVSVKQPDHSVRAQLGKYMHALNKARKSIGLPRPAYS